MDVLELRRHPPSTTTNPTRPEYQLLGPIPACLCPVLIPVPDQCLECLGRSRDSRAACMDMNENVRYRVSRLAPGRA